MRATLIVDETGNFEDPKAQVAVAGALLPDNSPWCRSAFIEGLYAKALPALPTPLHLQSALNWVTLAIRVKVLGEAVNRPSRPPPTLWGPGSRAALTSAAQGDGIRTDEAAALASEVAWLLPGSAEREILFEFGGLIGAAMQAPIAAEAARHADAVWRSWQWTHRAQLDRAAHAVAAGIEPSFDILKSLHSAAPQGRPASLGRSWFQSAAGQMKAGLSRANRVVFANESDARALWIAASESTGCASPAVNNGGERWLGLFTQLVERALVVAAARGFSTLSVTVLVPRYLPNHAEALERTVFQVLKAAVEVSNGRAPDLGTKAKLRFLANNAQMASRAKLTLADIAAFCAGRSLHRSASWANVKSGLGQFGIQSVESPGADPTTPRRPHLASTGVPQDWLAAPPPRGPRPATDTSVPWAWEQAAAWAGENP